MKKFVLVLCIIGLLLLSCSLGAEPIKIQLEWTAVGDDGNEGAASIYDIRYMECGDTLEFNWDNAIIVLPMLLPNPSLAGMKDSVLLDLNFNSNTLYCFALKVSDEANNWNNQSNIAMIETPDNVAPGDIQTLILRIGQ